MRNERNAKGFARSADSVRANRPPVLVTSVTSASKLSRESSLFSGRAWRRGHAPIEDPIVTEDKTAPQTALGASSRWGSLEFTLRDLGTILSVTIENILH